MKTQNPVKQISLMRKINGLLQVATRWKKAEVFENGPILEPRFTWSLSQHWTKGVLLLILALGSCKGQRSIVPVQYTAIFWDQGACISKRAGET